MIATILPSSKDFHAVAYNERKVEKGVAELIETKNFGYLQVTGNLSSDDLRDYLVKYSAKNKRIEKAQFHVAFSCKGHDYTPEQLLDIAHQWLDKMGYGQNGQPLLVYSHTDTPNTHIHIVTSRIDPNGKKVDHNNERVRSQKILNEIMGVDRQQEMHQTVRDALSYRFDTLGQFKAILESCGFETYTDDDKETLFVKKDGIVLGKLSVAELEKYYRQVDKEATAKRRKQLWSIMIKYRDLARNKDEMADELKRKFGVSLVFLGRKDNPYGYIIVDHRDKNVFKGNDIMSIKKLMQFGDGGSSHDPEKIKNFISKKIQDVPDISLFEINKLLLRGHHVCIKSGERGNGGKTEKYGYVACGKQKLFDLDQETFNRLCLNGKVKWLQDFRPASWDECEVLAKLGHVDDAGRLHIVKDGNQEHCAATVKKLMMALSYVDSGNSSNALEAIREANIIVMRKDGRYYAIDMDNKAIVDLEKNGIDMSKLRREVTEKPGNIAQVSRTKQSGNGPDLSRYLANMLRPTDSGHHANREWEINVDEWEYDDERRLKR